jgi:hypothetical protein
MRIVVAALVALVISSSMRAESPEISFSSAKKIWQESKDRGDYQAYANEFAQFNNYYHLDEKDGCYALGNEPVELMLIITHRDGDKYARIEKVLSNIDSPKARCFRKSYEGLGTKIPPFFPFDFQMNMGG